MAKSNKRPKGNPKEPPVRIPENRPGWSKPIQLPVSPKGAILPQGRTVPFPGQKKRAVPAIPPVKPKRKVR